MELGSYQNTAHYRKFTMKRQHFPPFLWSGWLGTRHVQLLLAFFGVVGFGIHAHVISFGVVAMAEILDDNGSHVFNYTLQQKGVLTGLYNYGSVLGSPLSGWLLARFGPIRFISITSGLCVGILSIAFPFAAAYLGYESVCVIRFLSGLAQSSIYPFSLIQLSNWCVPSEQSMASLVWAGNQVGNLLTSFSSGMLPVICWPLIFILPGIASMIWGLVCLRWGYDSPEDHPSISSEEKYYIMSQTSKSKELKIPWKAVLTSMPLWAYFVLLTCDEYSNSGLIPMESLYLNSLFNYTLNQTGFASTYNHLANVIGSILFVYVYAKTKRHFGSTTTQRVWAAVSFYGGAVALILLASINFDSTMCVVLFGVFVALNSATHPGYMTNILELTPKYAGAIYGIARCLSSLISMSSPIVSSYVVADEKDQRSWRPMFWIAIVPYVFGSTFFIIFGSGKVQPWNEEKEETQDSKLTDLS